MEQPSGAENYDLIEKTKQISMFFRNMGVRTVNLGRTTEDIKSTLSDLEEKLKYIRTPPMLDNLNAALDSMHQSLNAFSQVEQHNPGQNPTQRSAVERDLRQLKVQFLCAMVCSEDQELPAYANSMLGQGNMTMDMLIYSLKTYWIKRINFAGQNNTRWDHLWEHLHKELVYFQSDPPKIIESELKYAHSENGSIRVDQVDTLMRKIWGTFETFKKFWYRCKVFHDIFDYLSKVYLNYEVLQKIRVTDKALKLTVSDTQFPNHSEFGRGKTININPFGMIESVRFCNDKLVIFSKESNNNFLSDVKMPSDNRLSDCHMMVACMGTGYGLIDCSKNCSVFVRVSNNGPRPSMEVRDGTVFQIGDSRYQVNLGRMVTTHDPKVSGSANSSINSQANPSAILNVNCRVGPQKGTNYDMPAQSDLYFGTNTQCHFRPGGKDIGDCHAILRFCDNKIIIQHYNNEGEIWVRLKAYNNERLKLPSRMLLLMDKDSIKILDYKLFVRVNSDN